MAFISCSHDFSNNFGNQPINVENLKDKNPNEVTKEDVQANMANIFGSVDPNQEWNLVTTGTVTVVANAPLNDIVKVQILTESPFYNPGTKVLCEAEAKNGESVELSYEAPSEYARLIAACVDKDGKYYTKGFDIGKQTVSFVNNANARARTRGTDNYPDLSSLVLNITNSSKSYNAVRTELADMAAAGDPYAKEWVESKGIGVWAGKGWEEERLWKPTDKNNAGSSWVVKNGCIYRTVSDIDTETKQDLSDIFTNLLGRKKVGNLKQDNLDLIRNSNVVSLYNNHLISKGTPITITPVQMASTEANQCLIYYYYYDPTKIPSTVSEEEYAKCLPKFEAINLTKVGVNGSEEFFKKYEYLLPYYGDNLLQPQTMEGYTTDNKVFRIRNGQQYKENDYYLSFHGNKARCGVTLLKSDADFDLPNQLWQVFTNAEGKSFLYNLGTQTFLLHEEGSAQYGTSFTGLDYLSENDTPVIIDYENNCIRRTNSTTIGIGTDLDNESKAKNANVSSDKSISKPIGKWYFEEYQGERVFPLKTTIQCIPSQNIQAQSLTIPKNYKVGFMIRKIKNGENITKLDVIGGKESGCCYGFGSLNKSLNQFPNFSNAVKMYTMKIDDPRILMFTANDKTYLAFEEGVDCQFSDVIIEITEGVESVEEPIHTIESEIYTVCIEDRPLADYDLNDVVFKAKRIDNTHIMVSVVACGAYDDLFLRGMNGNTLKEGVEIHDLLGAPRGTYVNTNGKMDYPAVSEIFEVGPHTSMIEFLKGISIFDETINHTINFSVKGDDPHAIVVPCDFVYPTEKVRINTAYPLFNNWARDAKSDNGWYNSPAK